MKTILVVEDDFQVGEVIRIILEMETYKVLLVPNGEEAFIWLQYSEVDLILTDINLDGDGVRLHKKLSQDPKFQNIPIIFMTAATKKWNIDGKTIIIKPFTLEVLIDEVRKHLREKGDRDG